VVRARQDVEVARTTPVAGDEALRQAARSSRARSRIPDKWASARKSTERPRGERARSVQTVAAVDERPDVARFTGGRGRPRQVNDVKFQFSPTVDVRSAVATTPIDTRRPPDTDVEHPSGSPFDWTGGIRYGNLRDTRAQEVQAYQKLESARRQAMVQVEQARRGVRSPTIAVAWRRRRVISRPRTTG